MSDLFKSLCAATIFFTLLAYQPLAAQETASPENVSTQRKPTNETANQTAERRTIQIELPAVDTHRRIANAVAAKNESSRGNFIAGFPVKKQNTAFSMYDG